MEPKLTNTFSREIIEVMPPPKFKLPNLESYRGRIVPSNDDASFELVALFFDVNDALKCWLFFTIIKESML
ncbi:hypothetical protein IEQ34_002233 [Dendrobium chrysotoxum]|uniref:Uncharacterized protein n=1 Tax=Dendrobium chrysotoxum TaxID=161865 RepID=A0AAV7HJ65_DENCH|nr:hypothetical protein IEQ34_002233 [Dendrobium chrysotoxum]